ncbi:GNAT family N-acetyltransferase [Gemmata sp.]|uniref:GNAT family N-acetyltransferase n=1 Tax=Gemmata sp. TaxID=1914242 RepID=UPI003F6F8B6B
MPITYQLEPDLSPAEFIDVLVRSTLAERRPVDDAQRIALMLKNADVIVTARLDGLLVGVSRTITDFAYCAYLSDLAVDEVHQKKGIGRELIRRTYEATGPGTTLVLLAAPKARDYYPHIGMTRHDSCWIVPPRAARGDA